MTAAHAETSTSGGWTKHFTFINIAVGIVILLLIGMVITFAFRGTVAGSPVAADPVAKLTALVEKQQKQIEQLLAAKVAVAVPAPVAVPAAPVVAPVTAHSQCNPGWSFNGSICTREGQPTIGQQASSFVQASCITGETRTVDHEVIENGIPIKRQVLQTCGAK